MTTEDMIIHIFCLVDDWLGEVRKEPLAKLHPSEVITIGMFNVCLALWHKLNPLADPFQISIKDFSL